MPKSSQNDTTELNWFVVVAIVSLSAAVCGVLVKHLLDFSTHAPQKQEHIAVPPAVANEQPPQSQAKPSQRVRRRTSNGNKSPRQQSEQATTVTHR
jgi:hypothetical protein